MLKKIVGLDWEYLCSTHSDLNSTLKGMPYLERELMHGFYAPPPHTFGSFFPKEVGFFQSLNVRWHAFLWNFNLYPTRAPGRARLFKCPRYEGARCGALQPFKCTVQSCIGLELQLHSLSPNFIMVCDQIHAPANLPNYVHMHLTNSKSLAIL